MEDSLVKWIARWPGKILKPHDAQELLQLLGAGAINIFDYVFDPHSKAWTRIFEINDIADQFETAIGFRPNANAPEASAFSKPDFYPPTLLIQHAMSSERDFEGMNLNFEAPVYEDNSAELEFQKTLVVDLQNQNHELNQRITEMQEDSTASDEIAQLQREIDYLKAEVQNFEDQIQNHSMEKTLLNNRIGELEDGNKQLNQALVAKDLKLEEYLKENEKIVLEFKKLGQNNQAMKDRLAEVANKVDRERKTSATLKQNILKLNEGLVLLKRKGERDKSVIQDLERYKKIHDAKEEQEINRLIGDSFEVDNSVVWWIKHDGEDKGPYSYGDMRAFMKYGKINMSTTSKKTGGEWMKLEGHFEFKNDVLSKEEFRDGKKIQRFFIKRGDFRAPFYDLAQLEIGANSFKGYCSSLSVGGCFIELSKLDKVRMEKDGKVLVKIKAGTLSEELNIRAVIRNISDKRPRGLGLQFEHITEAQKDVIINFVKQYVASSSKKAA
ncbi:MAG: hypothetical protein COW01_00715 [Bdellovibrionales bacterium CG12_big_fil_rev_8_21_14_0_65_38_15]|nr:MAG: hypothetical protein COW79_10250 [Bdellovibrionales bacterium CG22_combo_CG10-13_8_21_14_all_38_13]PIQ57488.1 MAG: hypothetical protein COW01_00715 [Bdellovibrionales bacterium CG12_big_fil_rev_8_21_14_0_65_38_15]PIR31209.1 MAG: hypothetical protein COV38_02195 [Bdellovibrionales bacterium CG11_big_fil_rev_8_21_14_0_20_38_13]